jgi:DNA-binding transcriptional ArsR family regulator
MRNDEIQEQLNSLRREVRALGNSLTIPRQEELKRIFGEQVRSVLLEKIDRRFSEPELNTAANALELRAALIGLVNDIIKAFEEEGKERALGVLGNLNLGGVRSLSSNAEPDAVARCRTEIVQQVRSYLDIADVVFSPTRPTVQSSIQGGSQTVDVPLSSILAERYLGPLANSKRIDLLMRLSREEESLTELSRALDMKKGHLQFHLNALLDAGYIRNDRKSHLYSITPRGSSALGAVERLVEGLQAIG